MGDEPERPLPGIGSARLAGVSLQSASCTHWNAATGAEQSDAIVALTRAIGGQTAGGRATTLSFDQARTLFDRTCARQVARGFLLYEVYIRNAGFRSLAPG